MRYSVFGVFVQCTQSSNVITMFFNKSIRFDENLCFSQNSNNGSLAEAAHIFDDQY